MRSTLLATVTSRRVRPGTALVLLSLILFADCAPRLAPVTSAPSETLLPDELPLPTFWEVIAPGPHESTGKNEITWNLPGSISRQAEASHCRAAAVKRTWRGLSGRPEVSVSICGMVSPAVAQGLFRRITTEDALGEHDTPNLDNLPNDDRRLRPSEGAFDLVADDWESVCAIGSAKGICVWWMYRARYEGLLVKVVFVASGGGIRLKQFAELVTAVDRQVASHIS